MKTQRLLVVLTLVNLALLIFTLARTRPAIAEIVPVLRGRSLEIVDERGRVRASIDVLPAKAQEHETVLLRLITERGRPSIKIGVRASRRIEPCRPFEHEEHVRDLGGARHGQLIDSEK